MFKVVIREYKNQKKKTIENNESMRVMRKIANGKKSWAQRYNENLFVKEIILVEDIYRILSTSKIYLNIIKNKIYHALKKIKNKQDPWWNSHNLRLNYLMTGITNLQFYITEKYAIISNLNHL